MRRKHLPLKKAAEAEGIDPSTVLYYARPGLRQGRGGDYWATPYDHIRRTLNFVTPKGPVTVTVHDSRVASRIGYYANALRKYARTGRSSVLAPFEGKTFLADGMVYAFITDVKLLATLEDAGVLDFEELYASLPTGE
jgi:hypothetical protein